MPLTHQEMEAREARLLATYAQHCLNSRGRHYPQTETGWRTRYQRDRDRITHSRAFRRLESKTQVFLNGTGDHLRTRLTHTMEVAAISRNIARALNLNEDLTEAISLAHDLGHSPFGHKGEEVLNTLMKEAGGFEHNRQSLRIVEKLEQKYPGFPGLNLTWEVREGLAKHETITKLEADSKLDFRSPSLEAQVSDLADEITYYSHDLDDGFESGLLSEKELLTKVALWNKAAAEVHSVHPDADHEARRHFTIRCLIDREVRDVVETTERLLQKLAPNSADAIRRQPEPMVRYSQKMQAQNRELRDYLYENLYYHRRVHEPHIEAGKLLESLFRLFEKDPQKMPLPAQIACKKYGVKRAVCDYVAGMTDRFVYEKAREFALLP